MPSTLTGLCPCPSPHLSLLWLFSSHHVVPQDLLFQLLKHLVPCQNLPLILSVYEGSVLGRVHSSLCCLCACGSPSQCWDKMRAPVGAHFLWKPQLLQLCCGLHEALTSPQLIFVPPHCLSHTVRCSSTNINLLLPGTNAFSDVACCPDSDQLIHRLYRARSYTGQVRGV